MPWSASDATRFIEEPNTGCFLWLGAMRGKYGAMRGGRGVQYAHHVAYIRAHGAIPPGRYVCHTCDQPSCVNPEHLYLGTPKSNMDDKVRRGRWKGGRKPKGINPEARWSWGNGWPTRRARHALDS